MIGNPSKNGEKVKIKVPFCLKCNSREPSRVSNEDKNSTQPVGYEFPDPHERNLKPEVKKDEEESNASSNPFDDEE